MQRTPFSLRQAPVLQLLVVTLAIIGFFVASTVYSQQLGARLDQDAVSIASNASPSIEKLAAARSEVLRTEVALTRAIGTGSEDAAKLREQVDGALHRLREHLDIYLEMPFYPGEREHWVEVDRAANDFESEVVLCLAAFEGGRWEEARTRLNDRVQTTTERLDAALAGQVAFNALQQHRMGIEIPEERQKAERFAYLLDAVGAALALVLIGLAIREAHRRQAVLARFSHRLEEIVASIVRITSGMARDRGARLTRETIVAEACRLVGADAGLVGSQEEAASLLAARHPPLGEVMSVPLQHDGQAAGAVHLARREGRPPFTAEDEHIILLLAQQISVSLENARLYRTVDEQRGNAELISDATARLVSSLDYDETAEKAAIAVLPRFADLSIVNLLDESGAFSRALFECADPAWRPLTTALTAANPAPSEQHPARRLLEERRTARFEIDAATREVLAPSRAGGAGRLPMKHGLAVLIVGRDRLLGAMTFVRFGERPFGDEDQAFAEEFAGRVAMSLEGAVLHQHTRRAVQARDDLLAIVSHDLRNPLNAIKMALGLLERAKDEPRRQELAARIARTTDAMNRLIGDLLDASKIESATFQVEAKPEPVDTLIADALELFKDAASARSVTLEAELAPEAKRVWCDRDRLLQVVSNLLGNALKFTGSPGRVRLSVAAEGGQLRFTVSDSGPGIPEADRAHVFDRYWQAARTRRAGAGLGLFIVKGIVEAHGGRVWVEPSPLGGASICFTLESAATADTARG